MSNLAHNLPSTPPPRLRVALQRLVTYYAANGRSADADAWRSRLQAFDASRTRNDPTGST
jgi:hypothetical protein